MSVIINPSGGGSGGITQLTGDVTAGPGSGSQVATLASIIVAGGPIGDATHTPVITWDAKGRLTAVSSAAISGGGGGMSIGGAVTSGTPGSVLFVGAGPVLAQDNTNFFFDDTNFRLQVGHSGATTSAYYLNGVPAVYEVPNASGNNWFEGNSGNFTLTGFKNFGTGDGSLSNLTSGSQNTCVGTNAGQSLTSGFNNFVFGANALQFSQLDGNNTAIGVSCLNTLGNAGAGGGGNSGNFAAGFAAMNNAPQGFNNVAIGFTALSNAIAVTSQNVVIGGGAGNNLGSGGGNVSDNTLVGCNSGINLTGSSNSNTWIGGFSGPSAVVSHTIAIGTGTAAAELLDLGLSTNHVWTFSAVQQGQTPTGLHVYNIQDTNSLGLNASIINYERAVLDWNVTSNVFTIGTQAGGTGTLRDIYYYTAGIPALYRVANGSGDNWFVGGAGITSVSGANNVGLGAGALGSVSSGQLNFAIGAGALTNISTGQRNIGIGNNVLFAANTASSSIGLGTNALAGSNAGFNIAIGDAALRFTSGGSNVAIGASVMGANPFSGVENVAIGSAAAGALNGSSNDNTIIGDAAGAHLAGGFDSDNTLIGSGAFFSAASGGKNTIVGPTNVGQNITSGNRNTILGGWQGPAAGMSDVISIGTGTNALFLDYNFTNAGLWTFAQATMFATSITLTNGAAASLGTLTNAPAAGNPTKWIPINDNGTTRFIPAW